MKKDILCKQKPKRIWTIYSPITSWQIDGEKMETGADFIFLGSKTTVDDDYSHEIKKACSLEEKL